MDFGARGAAGVDRVYSFDTLGSRLKSCSIGNNHQAILFGYHIAIHRKVQIAIHPKVQLAILEFRVVK